MSVEIGRAAEEVAASYLERLGHCILDRNWRNRWCELDIVTRSAAGVHFVEVKYRHRTDYGTAIDYITPDKTIRLRRAALAWIQAHQYHGAYQIDVVSLEGNLQQAQPQYLPNAIID